MTAFYRDYREVIEVLHVVAIAEQISWSDLLEVREPDPISCNRHLRTHYSESPSDVQVGELIIEYDPHKTSGSSTEKPASFVSAFTSGSTRPEFQAAMQGIYADITPEARRRLEQRKQTPLALTFVMADIPDAETVTLLHLIRDMMRATAEPAKLCAVEPFVDDDKWRNRFLFSLKSVVASISHSNPQHPEFPRALVELLALGVELSDAINLSSSS